MQNQPKTVKTSQNRIPTPRVESKSQKDDFDYTRSTHQANTHQNMMNTLQNEDIAAESSIKTPSFTNFEQQLALLEHNLSPYERIKEQIESALNTILDNDEYFKFNSPDHLTSILIDRIHTEPGLMGKTLELKVFSALQSLNLSSTLLETKGVLALSQNCTAHSLKVLNLSKNPIGNSGIKFLAENSNWKDLHTLFLHDIQIDDLGAKVLAANESWTNLEELDLSQNPLLGSLGTMHLSYNRTWIHIKRLLLYGCNIRAIGVKYLQRNSLLRFNKEERNKSEEIALLTEAKNDSLRKSKEVSRTLITHPLESPRKYSQISNGLKNNNRQDISWLLRGGFPETYSTDSEYGELIIKLEQYREKILSENSDENEMNLYIEPLTISNDYGYREPNNNENNPQEEKEKQRSQGRAKKPSLRGYISKISDYDIEEDDEDIQQKNKKLPVNEYFALKTEPLDLFKDLSKNFLNLNEAATPNILLLTGEAGSGKSVFCRRLQKDLLSVWNSSLVQEAAVNPWFPVYVDCSLMIEFEADIIAKTLRNELSMTEEALNILQTLEASSITQPNLLIIFDGCDTAILKLLEEFTASEPDSEKCNIPHIFGSENFMTVKLLITCREESLPAIKQRDLLFAPSQREELLQSLFLQRRIEPFSDEQITRYLIKCCFYGLLEISSKKEIQEAVNLSHLSEFPSSLLPQSSWTTVKNFERMIDSYKLKDVARTPFMLKVIVEVLPSIPAEYVSNQDPLQTKALTIYQLIERFIDKAIHLNAQLSLNASTKTERKEDAEELEKAEVLNTVKSEIRKQLQRLALKLSGYSLNPSTNAALEFKVENSVLGMNSLLKWNENLAIFKFRHALVMEFLVAEQIKEELIHLSGALLKKEKTTIQKDMLLNQHLLKLRAALNNLTIRIIHDAVKDKQISPDLLYSIIDLSRQKEKNLDLPIQIEEEDDANQKEKQEETNFTGEETVKQQSNQLPVEKEFKENIKDGSYSQSHFELAAANAITILNMTEYDFSNLDLSNACIRGANLSYGTFEGANFANANLQKVNFTGAWLKNASFEKTNLHGVDFGEDSDLKTWGECIDGIAYSRNGRYLAVDIDSDDSEMVIYENVGSRYTSLRKVNSFSGNFSYIARCPFSINNKQVLTLLENQIHIWDINSGELLKQLNANCNEVLGISSDMKKIIFHNGQNIQIYSIEKDSLMFDLSIPEAKKPVDYDSDPNQLDFFAFVVINVGIVIYDSVTGKQVLKRRQEKDVKFNSNGKQMVSSLYGDSDLFYISDVVRGHTIKVLEYQEKNKRSFQSSLKFEEDILQYARDDFIYIIDIVSAMAFIKIKFDSKLRKEKLFHKS